MLEQVMSGLASANVSGTLKGFTNVDDGDIGIGLGVFKPCICLGVDIVDFSYPCPGCGRSPRTYTWMQSGDGAGVYPVIELTSASGTKLGALVVLDSPVRSEVTIATKLRDSNFNNGTAKFDFGLLTPFLKLRGTSFANLSVVTEIVFADARYVSGSESIPIWVDGLSSGEYQVVAFCEPMAETDALFEDNVLPVDDGSAPRPRVILVMKSNELKKFGYAEDFMILDSEKLINTWNQSMVLAYEESFAPETVEINAAVMQAKNGKDVRLIDDDFKEDSSPSPSDGLTKSSATSGLGLSTPPVAEVSEPVAPAAPPVSLGGLKKFCTECGSQFANESVKFCTECGTQR
ncbi:MAG: hypothetical protein RIR89_267 [Actinomycetota bacterium]|jgi:hypothetical protein